MLTQDLRVEVEAADRAAVEQSERAGAGACPGFVDWGGLKVPASRVRGGNQCSRRGISVGGGGGAGAARLRTDDAGEGQRASGARLRLDPQRAQTPPAT